LSNYDENSRKGNILKVISSPIAYDVIGNVTIRLPLALFPKGSQQETTRYIPWFPRYLASKMRTYIHRHRATYRHPSRLM